MPMYANLNNLVSPVTHAHYTIFTISFQLHNFVQHREMGIFLYKFQNLMILNQSVITKKPEVRECFNQNKSFLRSVERTVNFEDFVPYIYNLELLTTVGPTYFNNLSFTIFLTVSKIHMVSITNGIHCVGSLRKAGHISNSSTFHII